MVKPFIHENLDEKYHNMQMLMYYQYDILVDILEKSVKYNLNERHVKGEILKDMGENQHIMEFLKEKGRFDVITTIYKPNIFFSILVDFTDFILESLRCAEKGKTIVAFSLSRKPFHDNLFYLCWLLTKPDELVNRLLNDEIDRYDISNFKRSEKQKIKNIIEEACTILNRKYSEDTKVYDSEVIFNIIYEKSSEYGMAGVWDQSVHIITSNRYYRTKAGNLNFIFNNKDNLNEFTDYFYKKIPILLDFCLEVCLIIFEEVLQMPKEICKINSWIRLIKRNINYDIPIIELENLLKELLSTHLTMICDDCNEGTKMTPELVDEFLKDSLFICQKCGYIERTGKYLVEEKQLLELKEKMTIYLDD
ncbi:hypothetical protein [Macrococcus bovicus]|uniref:Uncharacterized protein n=1 Tax=Macrococcus bovicus TaxID=69968 RepID=A0A4R6BYH5_9STAP|nr:hypothetical protein [Macrococcus bovicus]TDM13571.1 hypothetical protein ERX55_08230 [Macrococcus bovicus]